MADKERHPAVSDILYVSHFIVTFLRVRQGIIYEALNLCAQNESCDISNNNDVYGIVIRKHARTCIQHT